MTTEDTYRDLRRHLRHLTVLHEVSTRIVSVLDPEEVVENVLGSLNQLVDYQAASLDLLREEEREEAVRVEPTGDPPQLVLPLEAGGRRLGALRLTLTAPLSTDDRQILELLATTAAVALQNAHLYQETQRLATTDALTGLSNYRHFHELLAFEVDRARRMEYSIGLVVMDLDYFKLVNDRHGHPVGDRALQLVSELLRSHLRRTDVIGRIGGEEFGVILPGDNLEAVAIVAEKLRKAIEELPPMRGGMADEPTQVTLSAGGTSLGPDVVEPRLLINSADRALYEAKRNGRNQVRLWRPDRNV